MAAPCLPGWQGRAAPWLQTSPGCCRHSPSQPGCGGAEGGQVIFPVSHIPPHPLCQRKGAILNPSLGTGPSPNKHLPAPPEGGKPHTKEPTSCEAPAAGQGDTPGGAPLPAPAPHGADLGGGGQTDRRTGGWTHDAGGDPGPFPTAPKEAARGGTAARRPRALGAPRAPQDPPRPLRAPRGPQSPLSPPESLLPTPSAPPYSLAAPQEPPLPLPSPPLAPLTPPQPLPTPPGPPPRPPQRPAPARAVPQPRGSPGPAPAPLGGRYLGGSLSAGPRSRCPAAASPWRRPRPGPARLPSRRLSPPSAAPSQPHGYAAGVGSARTHAPPARPPAQTPFVNTKLRSGEARRSSAHAQRQGG